MKRSRRDLLLLITFWCFIGAGTITLLVRFTPWFRPSTPLGLVRAAVDAYVSEDFRGQYGA